MLMKGLRMIDVSRNHSTIHAQAEIPSVSPLHSNLEIAAREWRTILGAAGVIVGAEVEMRYAANTAGISRRIPVALIPRNSGEVASLVKIAARHKTPLYPISTGKNWGYGCANPVTDDCAIVDLSQMNRILAFDAELGLVTVQPGVTQRMLAEYLDGNGLQFMVPVTGAGPDASLLGNAMERGHGLTPHADHFAAVMSLEAVLPDGQIYRSAMTEAGGDDVNHAFKWGIGPYLDGLFTQGNFGIATQITIALAPTPERVEAFFFSVKEEHLETAVSTVRGILNSVGDVAGAINLMNARRMLSMVEQYPSGRVPSGCVMPRAVADELASRNQITAWTGVGALYGTAKVVRAARFMIRRALRPFARCLVFLTHNEVQVARKATTWIPFLRNSRMAGMLERAEAFLLVASGRPSDIALPLAYWKSGRRPVTGQPLNPARDGCGLLWYAPLVPMKSEQVRVHVEMVDRICVEHGMESLITLTSLSNRCFVCTVPLLFDRENPEESARAHACYDALFKAGKREGFLPYRLSVHAMQHIVDPSMPSWKICSAIKRAIDPDDLISPGRYALRGAPR
jgi:4-cresol dehydrogenase (hydroxylating)